MKAWLPFAISGSFLCTAAASAAVFTGPAGSDQPFDNMQPYVAVAQLITTEGIFPSSTPTPDGTFHASHTLGMMRMFAGEHRPGNSAFADGAIHPITLQNADLFALIGPKYGGDNATNFALPDLRGRTIIGAGQGPGLSSYIVGQSVGSTIVTLTAAQMPMHTHGINVVPGQTGPAGGSQPVENIQPSLAMTYMIATGGIYQGGNPFIGQVAAFAGEFAPTGWLPADGRLVSISDFDTLFSLIGTTYGGDGQNTFALPDLRGRAIVGAGDDYVLGQVLGSETNVLTLQELGNHDHDGGAIEVDPAGGNQSFDNLQPSLALTYYVAITGVFPSVSDPTFNTSEPYLGEIVAHAGNPLLELDGYLPAFGQLLPINQNQALFALFGTAYGGNGTTNFALPDLRNRIAIGSGPGFLLGQSGGLSGVTLTAENLPTHIHSLPDGTIAAVPEPGTWTMLLLGFGLVGIAIRRRRITATA